MILDGGCVCCRKDGKEKRKHKLQQKLRGLCVETFQNDRKRSVME